MVVWWVLEAVPAAAAACEGRRQDNGKVFGVSVGCPSSWDFVLHVPTHNSKDDNPTKQRARTKIGGGLSPPPPTTSRDKQRKSKSATRVEAPSIVLSSAARPACIAFRSFMSLFCFTVTARFLSFNTTIDLSPASFFTYNNATMQGACAHDGDGVVCMMRQGQSYTHGA